MNKNNFILFFLIITFVLIGINDVYPYKNMFKEGWGNEKQFTKRVLVSKNTRHNNLNSKEHINLEVSCLKKLEKNYKCICKKKRQHFPRILNINYNKGIFIKYDDIILTHQGKSLKDLTPKDIKLIKNKNINFDEQIHCIISNLKRNEIIHTDIFRNNITINKNGDLSLIDFNRAYLKGFSSKNYDKNLKKQISDGYWFYKKKKRGLSPNSYDEIEVLLKELNT